LHTQDASHRNRRTTISTGDQHAHCDDERKRVSGLKRWGRRLLVGLGAIVAVLLVLGVVGMLYESVSEAADARAYPPPGQMVDVGGHRLHINCVGTGSPTVVIEAGWGDWSAPWQMWVQPAVAETTRVCTYDRAGMGYSEAGPLPRTSEVFARELHTLLQRAGEHGPYVLVGHSMGGWPVRIFAHEFPADVAGVVLIDTMRAEPAGPGTPPQTEQQPALVWLAVTPARIGLLRLITGPFGPRTGLSAELANAYTAFSVTSRSSEAFLNEGMGMGESVAQAGKITSLGAVPLTVLSAGLREAPEPEWQEWQRSQTNLLRLSSDSQQVFAKTSGHRVWLDQPGAAVGAIVAMVERIRRQAP
jgi:pimeloyl-ACP methyl ester carboxylesterase